MKVLVTALLIAGALVASAFAFVYAGIFNVAADSPHYAFVHTIMQTVRSRSIATRAKDVQPPPLDDAAMIATGARHYAAMCSGCHLAPDETNDSDMRAGLYPKPPDLTKHLHASPAEAFWVIKHGIKMSGMPAWGLPTTMRVSGDWLRSCRNCLSLPRPNIRPLPGPKGNLTTRTRTNKGTALDINDDKPEFEVTAGETFKFVATNTGKPEAASYIEGHSEAGTRTTLERS